MDEFTTISTDMDARGVVYLTLRRPEKKNALSALMIAELTEFARKIVKEPSARVVVLRGDGDVFCAGGDLDWMKAQINADRAGRMAEARKLAQMLQGLNEMPLPLIGGVQGGACLLYTSPSPRDRTRSRMPSSA